MGAILTHVKRSLKRRRQQLKLSLEYVDQSLIDVANVRSDAEISYRIEFFDGWPGEQPVCVQKRGSLRDVMKSAVEKYMKLNNRSDVQAQCSVHAVIPTTRVKIGLPREMWRPAFEEFGVYRP